MDIITPKAFRELLVHFPEREALSAYIEGNELHSTQFAGGDYNPPGTTLVLNICGVVFRYVQFAPGPGFVGAKATHSEWRHVRLPGINLAGSDLSHAEFYDAWIEGGTLEGATLFHVSMVGGAFHGTNLSRLQAETTIWEDWSFDGGDRDDPNTWTDLSGANFSGCVFRRCSFHRVKLNGANFRGAWFENCDFGLYTGEQIDFTGAQDIRGLTVFPSPEHCVNEKRPRPCDERGLSPSHN